MIFTSMFIRMTFHLMEIMILEEVGQNLNRDESVILAVIDWHVLVSFAVPSRFSVAEEILMSY